ncbi:MAG: hypothetical protein LRZ85_09845 [Alphaproteobacteria bacterium]|nr:hypothetical protein [Alphaproteobacteria bacterium]MCD8520458.1 hypothetical protein [Alphaproteobacteria bacterium]MCD8571151.1 hypothetical protein [Alphaproteobacteria bacterium]
MIIITEWRLFLLSKILSRSFYVSAGFAAGLGLSAAVTPNVNNHPLGAAFTQSLQKPVFYVMDGIAAISGYNGEKVNNVNFLSEHCPPVLDEMGIPVPCSE